MIGKPINGAVIFTAGDISKSVPIKLVPDTDQWPMTSLKTSFQMIRPVKVCCFMVGLNVDDQTVNPNEYNLQIIPRVIVVVLCVCVCVTTHICRLTHWNHKREIPTGS